MPSSRTDWRVAGIALLPALGVSVVVVLIGRLLNLSDSTTDRVSQILFFPTFLGAYYYVRRRRSLSTI